MDTSLFEKMEFNPFATDGKWMWTRYAKMARRKALWHVPTDVFENLNVDYTPTESDLDKLIRFVTLFCSQQSPFFLEAEYEERIYACSAALGLEENDRIVVMVRDGHWWVADVMSAYMQMENMDLFQNWLALKISVHNQRRYVMMPFTDHAEPEKMMAAQQKVAMSLSATLDQLASLELRLFPDSKSAQMVKESGMVDEIGGWAEHYAMDFDYSFVDNKPKREARGKSRSKK